MKAAVPIISPTDSAPTRREVLNMWRLPPLAAVLLLAPPPPPAVLITFTSTGAVTDSRIVGASPGDRITGTLTYDTATPDEFVPATPTFGFYRTGAIQATVG